MVVFRGVLVFHLVPVAGLVRSFGVKLVVFHRVLVRFGVVRDEVVGLLVIDAAVLDSLRFGGAWALRSCDLVVGCRCIGAGIAAAFSSGSLGSTVQHPAAFSLFPGLFFLVPAEVDDVRFLIRTLAQSIFRHYSLPAPLLRLVVAPHRSKCLGVGTEQTRAVGECTVDIQLRDLELRHCRVQLSQVGPGAGGNNGQFNLAGSIQILGFLRAGNVQGAVGPAQATFTVGHHGQMHVGAADAPEGAELAERFTVVAGSVSSQSHGFTHGSQPSAATAGCKGVLEGQLGLVINQAAGHDQVAGHPFRALGLKRLDLVLRGAVELEVLGTWLMTHAAATKAFIPQREGKVLSVTLSPHNGMPGMVHSGAARAAVETIAGAMGLTVEQAAEGIIAIVNENMAGALRLVSVQRGHDPRDFALVAYGGGGPPHATAVARELAVDRVVVPNAPAHFSAFGMMLADHRRDLVRTRLSRLADTPLSEIEAVYAEMEAEARNALVASGFPAEQVTFARAADMRYVGQEHAVAVPVPGHLADTDEARASLKAAFDAAHETRFSHSAPEESTSFMNTVWSSCSNARVARS